MPNSRFLRRFLAAAAAVTLLCGGPVTAALAGPAPASSTPAPGVGGGAVAPPPGGFLFVTLTDTHVGSGSGNRGTGAVVSDIASLPNQPVFGVHGGDVTELGTAAQYDQYRSLTAPLKFPVYHVPGNHDARWYDAGKAGFQSRFGRPYRSFDYGGYHFILLDTSVNAETHGHLDPGLLAWLAADLRRTGPQTPVLVFSHHPLGYAESRFIDNDDEFFRAVRGYNVIALFSGHGHLNLTWRRNGIAAFMTAAAMDSGYKLIAAGPEGLSVYNKVASQPPALVARVPAHPVVTGALAIAAARPAGDGDHLNLQVQASGLANLPSDGEYRFDLGVWRPLGSPDAVSGSGSYGFALSAAALAPGLHRVAIRVTGADGGLWTDSALFWRGGPGARLVWDFATKGGVQASPAIGGGVVYAASDDGFVYAIKEQSGGLIWRYQAGGAVIASPVLSGDTVYAGSADGKVHALDAAQGVPRWTFAAGAPVLGSPLVRQDMVYVGTMGGKMFALDRSSGQVRWIFAAGGPIRSAAAYGQGGVYFGAWDGKAYALDAASGRQRWATQLAASAYYAPAAAAPAYDRARVIFTSSSGPRTGGVGVWALSSQDGRILWRLSRASGFASPLLRDGAGFLSTAGGEVYSFNPVSGAMGWSTPLKASLYNSPAALGDQVVVGTLAGTMAGLDRLGRGVRWSFQVGTDFLFASPGAADGRLVVAGSMDGHLYAIGVEAGSPPPVARFPDLEGHWAAGAVQTLAGLGLVRGFPDGAFHPERPVTRAEMAAILARYMGVSGPSAGFASRLSDLRENWAAADVAALEERGIVAGYQVGDGKVAAGSTRLVFRPEEAVTRAEAAVLVARVLGLAVPAGGVSPGPGDLVDLAGHWARESIETLERFGAVHGFDGGNGRRVFRPDQPLSRAEAAELVAQTYGR